ncbi:hypothetical protein BDN70DRAFT_877891 [Pholiota conissans]|uniref:Uncharacterized protein n=1 Tax=Pholiota conissans TaxID=109636 RepID=A0A9P5Z4M8_9AGAR|nr:hypothetical protein BDN70DRAFT_877891 [Pholiota conissans]
MPLQMNGVEAWITGEDKVTLQEYACEVDKESNVVTCWIGGEPGQTFAIRWRDMADPTTAAHQLDISGFVTMDGYELGGRVLKARSYAPAIFSRIATSPTACLPLSFANLPRSAGIGTDWKSLGTISLDIHVVQVGEANRLHRGFSNYLQRSEGSPLSSATPFSSTEVTSLWKIATFIFKYRPLDVLRYHRIAPLPRVLPADDWTTETRLGIKRAASDEFDDDFDSPLASPTTPTTPGLTYSSGGSDSESSQDYTERLRPRIYAKLPNYCPQAKRQKV